jgi:hypothetical protein
LADLVGGCLGKPNIAIRPARDANGPTVEGRDWELSDGPVQRDLADLVGGEFGKPEVPVRPGGDLVGIATQGKLRQRSVGRDLSNFWLVALVVAFPLGDSKVAIWAGRDP